MRNSISYLRLLAMLEGVSLLLLLFIAMPLKYYNDMPGAVSVTGMTHGLLFMALVGYASLVSQKEGWSERFFFLLVLSSMVPFATFFMDRRLKAMA